MNKGLTRKVKLGAVAVALLASAGAAPVLLQQLADHGYDVPTIAGAERVMAMLDARSPGERTEGKLVKTKASLQKLAANVGPPKERALGKIVTPDKPTMADLGKVVAPPAQAIEVAPAIAPLALADVIPGPVEAGGVGGGSPGVPLLVGGGGGIGGGGGGGGGGGTPGTPLQPAPEVGAVPEPSTWMMMLLGFGAIGSASRRSRRLASRQLEAR